MGRRPRWLATLTQQSESPPYLLKYRSSTWFILLAISLAVFTDIFLYGVIVPVIPFALESRSHVPPNKTQHWVSILVAVYGVALLVLSPILGWIADQTSTRRSPLFVGLFALTGATVMLNLGSSTTVLVVARLLQGGSAAVVWVVGLALLADTVDQKSIGQSMGYVGLSMSIGILIAPLLGGVVFDRAGYNGVFAMCYALIGVDIILRLAIVEKKTAQRWITTASISLPLPTLGLSGEPHECHIESNSLSMAKPDQSHGLQEPRAVDIVIGPTDKEQGGSPNLPRPHSKQDTPNLSGIPALMLPSETRHIRKRRHRLPPVLFLLTSRRLLAALWGCFIQAALTTSFDSTLPIHVSRTFSWTSTGAGLLFLPIVIPSFVGPIIGWLSDKYGPRYLATAGFVLCCPLFISLRFVTYNSLGQKILLCVLLSLIGLAITLMIPTLLTEITSVVNAKEDAQPGLFGPTKAYAQAYALFNMAFATGCIIGPIWAGFVNEKAGWATMGWTLGLLSAITAIPTFILVGGPFTLLKRQ